MTDDYTCTAHQCLRQAMEMRAEIEALRKELDACKERANDWFVRLRECIKENESLRRDAARIDWIDENGATVRKREHGAYNLVIWNFNRDGARVTVREAIDAAMGERDGK